MSGNLVVISGNKICFSDYIRKPNGLFSRIDLLKFIDIVDKRFVIPIKQDGLIGLVNGLPDPKYGDTEIPAGPLALVYHSNCCFSETSHYNGKLRSRPVMTGGNSWYVRSDEHCLESAATAAAIIYNQPDTIYKEAYKACGMNRPSFYTCRIKDLQEPIENLHKLNQELNSMDKESPLYKDGIEKSNFIIDNLETILKLTTF